MEFFDIFIFNNVKSDIKIILYQPNKVASKIKVLSLYRLYPCRKPQWAEVGQTYIYGIRRNCTLWFSRHKNFATSNRLSKTKQRERLMKCIIYSPIGFGRFCRLLSIRVIYIFTLAWGFRRCSFRQSGQCEGLYGVERVTG